MEESMVTQEALEGMRNLFLFAVLKMGGKLEITRQEYDAFLQSGMAFVWNNSDPDSFVVSVDTGDEECSDCSSE